MDAFDVSAEDEYYPEFRHICRGCQSEDGGAEDGHTEPREDNA
jgi:hypothetical protein